MTAEEIGFDDDGVPVPVTAFDFASLDAVDGDVDSADETRIRLETITRLLAFISEPSRNPKTVSRRVAVLAFVAGVSPFKTQVALADSLGISEPAISVAIKTARERIRTNIWE